MAELKGLSPDAEIITNSDGGKQSKVEYGFHLCDYGALFALAEVLQYGASRYERDNWRKIPAEEHFNHMMIHALAYLSGDKQDDHLGHMFCRAMMFYATAKAEEANKSAPATITDKPEEEFNCPAPDDVSCKKCPLSIVNNAQGVTCDEYAEMIGIEKATKIRDEYLNKEEKE